VTPPEPAVRPISSIRVEAPARATSFGCTEDRCRGPTTAAAAIHPDALPPSWENQTGLSALQPPARAGASFAYDGAPGAGYDVLFGGETSTGFLNDTWAYRNGTWTNITTSACHSFCPPELAYATMAFDPATETLVLVGGLSSCPMNGCGQTLSSSIFFFRNGSWAPGLGSAPHEADASALAWYAPGRCLLLFGGAGPAGPSGSTNCYDAANGTWANLTGSPSPSARWGAAMTNSSLGYDVLFGGSTYFGVLNDTWIFVNGSWKAVQLGGAGAPPGRTYGVLAESPAATVPGTPASGDVVLFGGAGSSADVNDSWTFRVSTTSGAGGTAYGNWTQDLSVPTPPASYGACAALDFNASRVILTQGAGPGVPGGRSVTWAYFHLAALLNESLSELNAQSTLVFTTLAGGGSPAYQFVYTGLPPGCASADVTSLPCTPTQHGRFVVTVTVTDQKGRTASSNVSLIVDPYGSRIYLRTQFEGLFYAGFPFPNTFAVDTTIAGRAPAFVRGTLGGMTVTFDPVGGTLWNATVDMGLVTPGARLSVEANYTNWSLFSSRPVPIVDSPAWMRSIFAFPGAIDVSTVNTSAGAWNASYSNTVTMGWSLGTLLNFALPTPGFSGAYSMIPGITATFTFDSGGNVSLEGRISSDPSITIGPVDISAEIPGVDFSATVDLSSAFAVQALAGPADTRSYTVQWNSLTAKLDIDADFSTEVPLFPAESPEGGIGLSLLLKIAPSVSVTLLLAPSAVPGNFLAGLDIMVEDLLVDLGIAFTVALQAGISDVFEIGGGGTLSLQTLFQTATPHLAGLWLNASVFAFVQLLCFKITWTLWSGTLYQYGGDPPALPAAPHPSLTWSWNLAPRYYNTSAYDTVVWNANESAGPAVEDIYPATSVAIAPSGAGALVAYTTDRVAMPEREGLGLQALSLGGSNSLGPASVPVVPGAIAFSPELLALPGGGVRAVFSVLPDPALAGSDPSSIPGYALDTSERAAAQTTWSAPVPLVDWGYPISSSLAACGSDGALAVLDAPGFAPNLSTPERLLVYDPANGALEGNVSVRGMAKVTGYDCSARIASLTDASGNVSFLDLVDDATIPVSFPAEPGWNLTDIAWVAGANGTTALLYRGPAAAEAVLYEPASGTTVDTAPLPANASALAAVADGPEDYLFAGVPGGVRPFLVSSSGVSAMGEVPVPGLTRFGVAIGTGAIALYALGATGNATEPIDTLILASWAVPSTSTGSGSHGAPSLFSQLASQAPAVLLGVLLAALLLAAVWLYRSARKGPGSTGPSSLPSPGPSAPDPGSSAQPSPAPVPAPPGEEPATSGPAP
jgi:hypothetical protein